MSQRASTDSCRYLPLTERDLADLTISPDERQELSQHLASGCAVCEERIAFHLEESKELDPRLEASFAQAEQQAERSRSRVMDRLAVELGRDRERNRRNRRRHLRALFYLVNVTAGMLLLVTYAGFFFTHRWRERAAATLATRAEVRALVTAISRYAKDHGRQALPRDLHGLVQALQSPRPESPARYYRFLPPRLGPDGGYRDEFGHSYRYRPEQDRALLYSVGPNGRDDGGQGDDIPLWVLFAD